MLVCVNFREAGRVDAHQPIMTVLGRKHLKYAWWGLVSTMRDKGKNMIELLS